uniref:Ig-like domain-containing protein n=1 Tax=Gallus gallus TaxID=9031 RepID=A0A8V0XNK9_CHICK
MALAAPHRTMSYCCPLPHADLRYPPSSISLHPQQHVGTGTNVTIRCWNKDYGATFLLHKDGSSDPIKHQNSSGGGTATFTLFGREHAGTYRCRYQVPKPLKTSEKSDPVELVVTGEDMETAVAVCSHRTLSPMWLNPTSCASPNPADGNI